MKKKKSVQGSEKDQQVIKNLRAQLEEAKRIEELQNIKINVQKPTQKHKRKKQKREKIY